MNKSDFTVTTDSAAQPRLAIGKAQLGLGDQTQELDSLPQGIAIARNVDNLSRPRELSLAYQDILIERGEYLIALDYLKVLTTSYTHSLAADTAEKAAQSDETTRRLTSLRVSNELDVKEQELALSIEREVAAKASQSLMDLTQWESSMDC